MSSKNKQVLGKQIAYPLAYSPEILVAIPRELNRIQYDLHPNIPFIGVDVWHAYELSFLTQNGLPVCGVLKIVYSAQSKFIVESKSLKLYLNSLNMERFGTNTKEGAFKVLKIIKADLSALLDTEINVHLFCEPAQIISNHEEFILLDNLDEIGKVEFKAFKEAPELLVAKSGLEPRNYKFKSNLLRSNCKVTQQPDWGTVLINIKTQFNIEPARLLEYIVSFRNENHFHEEVCEMIYKRLWDAYKPEHLSVICIYTRRGGIDICPVRVSHAHLLPENLCDVNSLTEKELRQ